MNLNIFRHNETVQVLDETTYIWEAAKIMGFECDWSVRVKWVEWSSKPAILIVVPENLRTRGVECWNIRKYQENKKPEACSPRQRPRRQATVQHPDNYHPFMGNPAKLTRYVEVNTIKHDVRHGTVFDETISSKRVGLLKHSTMSNIMSNICVILHNHHLSCYFLYLQLSWVKSWVKSWVSPNTPWSHYM